jgi:hypothetical protein
MRDCLFLVADKNMEGTLLGLLSRPACHRSLGTGPFDFDPRHDLIVAHGQNDPGLYTRANELLRPYVGSHRHAVVIMDAAWNGAPPTEVIRNRLAAHLGDAGWVGNAGCAVVINPELECWFWQDSPHVCTALGHTGDYATLRIALAARGFWRDDAAKPHQPKEAVDWALRRSHLPRSSSIYRKLASLVSVRGCLDPAWLTMVVALREWFPAAAA